MSPLSCVAVVAALLSLSGPLAVQSQDNGFYTAAVLEYSPLSNGGKTPEETILANVKNYVSYIEQAKKEGSDIVVFPEYGLTGLVSGSTALNYSVSVPDSATKSLIYTRPDKYAKLLVDLSAAASTHQIYVVANLLENATPDNKPVILHNTNVVFDRKGALIAKYRKINLFDEDGLTPGDQLVTFETDFGVTFATFVCFDVLFKRPALDVLAENPKVTDVVFPTFWMSETPFLHSVSAHSGYARAAGVNFLSSAFSNVGLGATGSGIYSHTGAILEKSVNYEDSTRLVVARVPKITARTPPTQPSVIGPRSVGRGIIGGQTHSFSDNVRLLKDDLKEYSSKSLSATGRSSGTVCSGDYFCCSYEVDRPETVPPTPVYKMVAFYGVRKFGKSKTGGVRVCGLVACDKQDSQLSSCSKQFDNRQDMGGFLSIAITGTFDKSNDTFDFPTSLTATLDALSDREFDFYAQEAADKKGKVSVVMKTKQPTANLTSFAIYGRVFNNDDLKPGTRNAASAPYNGSALLALISLFYYLY